MKWLFESKATPIWALLFSATCLSWAVGSYHTSHSGLSLQVSGMALILIASVKIRFVLLHFMELKHAPWIWRGLFEAWVALLSIALLATYLMT